MKFLASTVYHKKFDICEELGKLGQNCPLGPTNVFVNETYPIPKKGYPHVGSIKNSTRMALKGLLLTSAQGSYSFTAFAKFPDGRPITCIEGKVKL